jgi:two-component system sensor histidine kinase BarA
MSFCWAPWTIYLLIPLTLVAAIVCGVRGAALSVLIVTILGMAATARMYGPFAFCSTTDLGGLFRMGAFALCLGVPGLFTAITLDQLRNHRRDLEGAVAERTAELAFAKERAEASDEAKSEFLASMAHEIRTPMNGVIGYARLLETSKLDADQQDSVQSIVSSGEMLLNLVNELLDLSKIEAGAVQFERREVELRRIAPEVIRLLSIEARDKGLKMECTVDAGVPERLFGDPTRIKQVLLNLVSNAVKFTQRGGVSVRITSMPEPAQPGQPARHCVTLSVADTGIGISEEQMKRIFTSFGQADPSIGKRFGGSGLGLVISRRLCELMNGSLEGSSEPNHGSVFTARLVIDA